MGVKTARKKPRNLLLSVIYRVQKVLPMSSTAKFKLFLNLEWIFERLAHEMSFKQYTPDNHPGRSGSKETLLGQIKETSVVLDLGCNLGDISFIIAQKAKEVIGIDHNKTAIETAKQRYSKANLIFYHREALDYLKGNSKKFDTLVLSHILEHLDNPLDFLKSFKNYFEFIYIEVPDFDKSHLNHYRKDLHLDLVYTDDDHVTEFDRNELRDLLNECGLQIIKEEYQFGLIKIWCTVPK